MATQETKPKSQASTETVAPKVVYQAINKDELDALDMRAALRENEIRKKALHKKYATEKKVPVTLAPSYANHFGRVMFVTINGISVAVPVNGLTYEIPETFATEVNRRRLAIDEIERKQQAMADISQNLETAPGQLPLL